MADDTRRSDDPPGDDFTVEVDEEHCLAYVVCLDCGNRISAGSPSNTRAVESRKAEHVCGDGLWHLGFDPAARLQ